MNRATPLSYLFAALLLVVLASGCRRDSGEPLFDLVYPPLEFNLPAGQSPFTAPTASFTNIPTNYANFLTAAGHSFDEVSGVVPLYARLTSLDGLDFGAFTAVSIRVCPITQGECTQFDEVFYLDDLYRRNISVLRLDPGLRNVKDLLEGDFYRMEIVFFPGEVTPYSLDIRLEYGFQAVR
ncbi:MAG: hypothetical protein KDC54_22820 [Lewinella sp.]|nr:hypothetical protein [Lewinella sp.]